MFRYSRALIIFWVITLIAVAVFYSQTAKRYESKAKVLISLGSEALGKADYLNGQYRQLLQREQQLHDEQQILESHEVMLTTAKWIYGDPTPGGRPPAADWRVKEAKRFLTGEEPPPTFVLRVSKAAMESFGRMFGRPKSHAEQLESMAQSLSDALAVKAVFDSDALDVSFRYSDPRVAQTVLNLILAAYVEHHIAVFQSAAEADLLKTQLDRSVDQYHDRLQGFSSFMTEHGVYNDDSQVNGLIEQREKVKQALTDAMADSDAARARFQALQSIQQSLHEFEKYSTTEVRNKQREALLAKLDDASVEEQVLLNQHPKGSRAYQEEQSKLDEIRRLLQQEPVQVVEETQQRKSQASEFVDSEIINVTETQRSADARTGRLREDLQNIDAEINNFARYLKGFDSLKLELAFAKQESERLNQVYLDSRLKNLTAERAITDVSVIDLPTWDPVPASPKKKIVAAATILLLLAGSLAVFLACIGFDTTVADGGAAELQLGASVAGTLPVARNGANAADFPEMFTRENHRDFARIYQSVRANGSQGNIIVLAGSGAKEGGSLVGYGLALFLSRYAREKTVFVDRTLHPVIKVTGDLDASAPTVLPWHGTDESTTQNAAGILSTLSKLRQEFTYVVVAAGAVKDTTDLFAISEIASATFLIVDAGKTRLAAARHSLEQLRRFGFKGIQLILNRRVFYIPGWVMRFV